MSVIRCSIVFALLLMCTSVVSQGTRTPGSVLVYPIHRSGGASGGLFFTAVCVTNINTDPVTPANFGGSTLVHFEYVNSLPNPQNPFCPIGCSVFDRVEFLTPADTLCVLTSCHNPTFAPGQSGYLVVSAQDPSAFGVAWSHNHLIGSELVMNASGITYALNAIALRSPRPAGAPTDVAPPNGRLDFNGVEFEQIPDLLYIDSFLAVAGSGLTLINLTGGVEALNTVLLSIWNDNEFPLSTTLEFKCWFDQPLGSLSPLFTQGFLSGLPNDPGELDIDCDGVGDAETGWAIIDSIQVRTPGGVPISNDGALLGAITAGSLSMVDGGHLLWESETTQDNGSF